jgi:hypothetical protein
MPLCPWCIHDGSAHSKLDVTFVDSEAFDDDTPAETMNLICERTPGFNAWQGERWPSCCGEPAAFVAPIGAEEIRTRYPRLEGPLMTYIVHDMSREEPRGGCSNLFGKTIRPRPSSSSASTATTCRSMWTSFELRRRASLLALGVFPMASRQASAGNVTLDVRFSLLDANGAPIADAPVRLVFDGPPERAAPGTGTKFTTDALRHRREPFSRWSKRAAPGDALLWPRPKRPLPIAAVARAAIGRTGS